LVEQGVLHEPGQDGGDLREERELVVGVAAAFTGVQVEGPHDAAAGPDEGQRHHGGEVLAPQRGDVLVAGVAPLVLDDRGLPVGHHPAGDAFADGQFDRPHHRVERRRGAGQDEAAPRLVVEVHEAGVGAGELGDEPGQAAHDLADVMFLLRHFEDPGEEGLPARAAHRKRPSRSAAATACDRSATSSLR
jgi:hypothetical protein